ncbi:DBH monooxygenase -like protein [Brachionus plicatilis]|uniref:DBH monooxygenase-like protein n=1 Tax=Brachionus plicatilis TaxID=10195 RepID=A0A3M7RT21_BRAPC|nr:DBH monooxygenase -like protein [Brachionus plicatilis]
MFFRIIVLLYCLLNFVQSVIVQTQPTEDYKFNLNVDEKDELQYKLYWKILRNDEIQFELHCRTTGWVGFGISPNGGMSGSDIMIGWIDSDGNAHLKDTHAISKSAPLVDDVQNWELLDASENEGYTILKVKRKLRTCDNDDIEIRMETQRLIFAWSDSDPEGEHGWTYHFGNRRIKSVVLLNFLDETNLISDSEISHVFESRIDNHLIPNKDTYYLCQTFALPPIETDLHLVAYDILMDKSSIEFLHHLTAYVCEPEDVEQIKKLSNIGYECGPGGDEDTKNSILKDVCDVKTLMFAWAVGGKTNASFPDNTGLRIPKSDRPGLLFVDFHFDNSRLIKGHRDNSGLRLKLTKKLRKYDLGVLAIPAPTNPLDITIPPKTDLLKISSICYPLCTEEYFPEEGITVFAGNFHTHLTGQALRTHLIRDGKEVKYLFDDPHYDFNYQSNIYIQPTLLKKGDAMVLDCFYSTKNKNTFTFGGYGTKEEMCGVFMYYYPRMDMIGCASKKTDRDLAEFYNLLIEDSIIPPLKTKFTEKTIRNRTMELVEHLKNVLPSKKLSERYIKYFENESKQSASCAIKTRNTGLFFEKDSLKPKEHFVKKDYCENESRN